MQDKTDEELAALFKTSRSSEAFEVLARRHAPMVFATCHGILGNTHDAEDACQAVFLVMARKIQAFRVEKNLSGWLYRIARRMALDMLRTQTRRIRREEAAALGAAPGDGRDAADPEVVRAVFLALDALPGKEQQAVMLRYVEGCSQEEAARIAGCPVGTLGRRASDGIARLRDRLATQGVVLGAGVLAGALVARAPETLLPMVLGAMKSATATGIATATVSSKVVLLAQQAIKAMLWDQVKTAAIMAAGVALIAGGVAATARLALENTSPAGDQAISASPPLASADPRPWNEPQPAVDVVQGTAPRGTNAEETLSAGAGRTTIPPGGPTCGPVTVTAHNGIYPLGAWVVQPGVSEAFFGRTEPGELTISWQMPGGKAQSRKVTLEDKPIRTVLPAGDGSAP